MIIYFNGNEYDIPIQKGFNLGFAIDDTLNNGYVETAPLEDIYGDLDVTRRIPRGLLVKIKVGSKVYWFKTGEVSANQVTFVNEKWKHTINLISLTKDLQRLPLENITVTQPKGDLGTYSRSVSVVDPTYTDILDNYSGEILRTGYRAKECYEVDETQTSIPFIDAVNTNTSKIDGLDILSLEEYNISVNFIAYNLSYDRIQNLDIIIKYNGTIIKTQSFELSEASKPFLILTPSTYFGSMNFKYTPSTNGTITVEAVDNDEYSNPTFSNAYVEGLSLSITAIEVIEKPIRTYAQVEDKILRHTNYVLSSSSRSRLNLTCPEYKFEEYTIYDASTKLASNLGALVKVGNEINQRFWKVTSSGTVVASGDSIGEFNPYDYDLGDIIYVGTTYYENTELDNQVREIDFKFFDRPNTIDLDYRTKTEIAELEDFVSAVELNTKNVVKPLRYSPFKNGWKGVRSSGIGQQTTDNILYELEDIADNIIEVKVKGLASRNSANTVTWSESDETTLTLHDNPLSAGTLIQSHIVNLLYYNTLTTEKDVSYSGKTVLRKHNCLYHEQGTKFLDGLTYLGEDLSQVVGSPNVIRAWVETILAVRSEEAGELITRTGTQSADDEGLDGDIKLMFQITYANITESRARVYKDDQSAFEQDTIKYINESANINESQAIGDYAQLIVNRLGGTKIVYGGITDSIDDLPEVGDINSNGEVYTLIKLTIGKKISYEITAVQDYNVISSYIGIKSAHRNEEISSNDSVLRTMRYTSKFVFTDTYETFSTRFLTSEDILSSLFENTDLGLNYGYLECNLSNGETKKVHLSIDSDSKGKTIEIKWRLKDNYSAGLQRYMETISGTDVYLNKEVPYTDYYGKVNDILISLYYDTTSFSSADLEEYPEASSDKGDTLFTIFRDSIDKDARETIGGLVEIPILSESDSIQVYNGFAKYNKLVEGTDRIATALLKYVPRKNDKLVDTSRIVDMSINSYNFEFGEFDFTVVAPEDGLGVVWYNIDTLELVLAYIGEITSGVNSITKYYRIDEVYYNGDTYFISQTFAPIFALEADLQYTRTYDTGISLDSEIALSTTLNFTRTNDIGISISSIFGLSSTLYFKTLHGNPPTITFISRDDTSVTFTVKNNDLSTLYIFYDVDDSTPNNYVILAHNQTSSQITISGLTKGASHTIYSRAGIYGMYSALTTYSFTTIGWDLLGSSSDPNAFAYDYSTKYFNLYGCPTTADTREWLETNYPSSGYSYGDVFRVNTLFERTTCDYKFFIQHKT